MRTNIIHPGADSLHYEIREIVAIAKKIEARGKQIVWENIGDPIAKGEQVPDWIKEYVTKAALDNQSYAYSPTKGLLSAREYIAKERNLEGGLQITPEDILFMNGLGDAISKIYQNLNPKARIIGPNPAYPTHSSAEAAHADAEYITYKLRAENGWRPDLEEMEQKIIANPDIAGILIINPDNPTGYVYTPEVIEKIVDIAKRHKLFLVSDEIYSNLAFTPDYQKLASVVDDVPAIAMRGISKEFPWPGSRCGWLEFYNRDKDEEFDRYAQSIIDSKMLEVCSTTLPQQVLPEVMSDERYYPYLAERCETYQEKADMAIEILGEIEGVTIHKPQGAFYLTVVFDEGVLNDTQTLPIEDIEIKALVELLVKEGSFDRRFVYYLLGATGMCVVPLTSGFNASYQGFRMTLLEPDKEKFRQILEDLKTAITQYIAS